MERLKERDDDSGGKREGEGEGQTRLDRKEGERERGKTGRKGVAEPKPTKEREGGRTSDERPGNDPKGEKR